MLNTITATLDGPAATIAPHVERDEFGTITGRPGLFTAPIIPIALAETDSFGRPLYRWAPDGDLL